MSSSITGTNAIGNALKDISPSTVTRTWGWDQDGGKEAAARTLLPQAASLLKAEDDREGDGRRYRDELTKWKERNPRVAAKVIAVNIAGQRRT